MTDHVARLYALVAAVLGFFLAWAGIAAHPWRQGSSQASTQGASTTLATYEAHLNADAALLAKLAARRQSSPAAVPSVRVVSLPPLTTTRTS